MLLPLVSSMCSYIRHCLFYYVLLLALVLRTIALPLYVVTFLSTPITAGSVCCCGRLRSSFVQFERWGHKKVEGWLCIYHWRGLRDEVIAKGVAQMNNKFVACSSTIARKLQCN